MTYTDEFGHSYGAQFHDQNCPQCTPTATPGDLHVPMRKYFRPNGGNKAGFLVIDSASTPERKLRIQQITHLGLQFTMEDFPGEAVNICMDSGVFDYKNELVHPSQVNVTVLQLIDEFDAADYQRTAEANDQAENASIPWANEG